MCVRAGVSKGVSLSVVVSVIVTVVVSVAASAGVAVSSRWNAGMSVSARVPMEGRSFYW